MSASGSAVPTNPVKERMTAGEVAPGLNVRIARSGDIPRIAKTTGLFNSPSRPFSASATEIVAWARPTRRW